MKPAKVSDDLNYPVDVLLNWQDIRKEIHRLYGETSNPHRRDALLAVSDALMDAVERHLIELAVAPDVLARFREARGADYRLSIAQAAKVAAISPAAR